MTASTTIVIFGASGDLSKRKLIPALFNLFRKGRLPEKFNILGFSSSDLDHQAFRERIQLRLDSLPNTNSLKKNGRALLYICTIFPAALRRRKIMTGFLEY